MMKVSGLTKAKKRITFDIVIPTPKGAIYCAYLCCQGSEVAATSQVQKKISVNLAHMSCLDMVMRAVQEKFQKHWDLRLIAVH